MALNSKLKHITAELKGHAPFTLFGAILGIISMLTFRNIDKSTSTVLFNIFHPGHVLLSAMVTASMFGIHRKAKNFLLILIVGYVGSIGVATLSDCLIPYAGETLLGLHIPAHSDLHNETNHAYDEHPAEEPESAIHEDEHENHASHSLHIGFIETWWIVHPMAILGVLIAYFIPRTKFPHAGHVLISTWATSAHIMMNTASDLTAAAMAGIFIILFIAVWLPCCISDIVFPLLFVKSDIELIDACECHDHSKHSHPHIHEHTEKCHEESD